MVSPMMRSVAAKFLARRWTIRGVIPAKTAIRANGAMIKEAETHAMIADAMAKVEARENEERKRVVVNSSPVHPSYLKLYFSVLLPF